MVECQPGAGIHGSNPRKLHALAVPFYSVIPLTEFDRHRVVAKLLKLGREMGLEPVTSSLGKLLFDCK
jgi:hypothetical protein